MLKILTKHLPSFFCLIKIPHIKSILYFQYTLEHYHKTTMNTGIYYTQCALTTVFSIVSDNKKNLFLLWRDMSMLA